MERVFDKVVFVLLALTALGRLTLGERSITCSAPETVNEEDAASLTFHFGEDPQATKQDFYVYKFRNGSEPVIVTLCEYAKNTWRCDTMDGYSVQTTPISNVVTVEISSAQQSQSGNYVCKTLPAAESPSASVCSLTVKAKPKITCDTNELVTVGQSTSLTCKFEADLRATEQDFYVYKFQDKHEPVIIALCTWNGIGEHACEVTDGYSLSPTSISKNVTLSIPSASGEHSGNYICKTLPAQNSPPAQQCSLVVQNKTESLANKTDRPALMGSLAGCLIVVFAVCVLLV